MSIYYWNISPNKRHIQNSGVWNALDSFKFAFQNHKTLIFATTISLLFFFFNIRCIKHLTIPKCSPHILLCILWSISLMVLYIFLYFVFPCFLLAFRTICLDTLLENISSTLFYICWTLVSIEQKSNVEYFFIIRFCIS